MDEIITKDNFVLICAKHYNSRQLSSTEEFLEDLKRVSYIRKLITRYNQTGELKERLILNHIIILNNVFGPEFTTKVLYFKMKDVFDQIKPFLVLLNTLPDRITINSNIIYTAEIGMDPRIIEALRKI
jgi:hypothetical protein